MKVFTTLLSGDQVVLKTFSSVKEFNQTESWLDKKFIFIATSEDFKEGAYLTPHFNPLKGESGIKYSQNELDANYLLCEARCKHLKLDKD